VNEFWSLIGYCVRRIKPTRREAVIIFALIVILAFVVFGAPAIFSKRREGSGNKNNNTLRGNSGSNSNTAQASGNAIVNQATGNATIQIGNNTTVINQGVPAEQVHAELERLWGVIKQQLRDKYPAGYALFGAANGQVVGYVPPQNESADWKIDVRWDTAKLVIKKDHQTVMLISPFTRYTDLAGRPLAYHFNNAETFSLTQKGPQASFEPGWYFEVLDAERNIFAIGITD
jgi:hypothetical protein